MLNVAAYCRVSTDNNDQANSLKNQIDYFYDYIKNQSGYNLIEVYADEGISGTSTKKRINFNRMIKDSEAGKIDLILTKEVSRFARNTVDTLRYTRLLKSIGTGVIFINDNIDTRDNDGEFRLSIMASVAQEESRKTSERVKWGQKRAMEKGVVFGNSVYGYRIIDGKLEINPEEAHVIKLIFQKYAFEGKGTYIIAKELYNQGIKPPKSNSKRWSEVMISRILNNEKYVGDLEQKKHITPDYLTHKKILNKGQEEKIYIHQHHQGIIDRATWEKTQEEIFRRSVYDIDKSKYSNRYWCSGLIKCSKCGSRYVLRKTTRADGDIYKIWVCKEKAALGKKKIDSLGNSVGCDSKSINEKSLLFCMNYILHQLITNDADNIIEDIIKDLNKISYLESDSVDSIKLLEGTILELQQKKKKALDVYLSEIISDTDFKLINEQYNDDIASLVNRLNIQKEDSAVKAKQIKDFHKISTLIKNKIYASEEVLKQVIEWIIANDNSIKVKINHLPLIFDISYSTYGAREAYTTVIEECNIISS